MSLGRCRRSWSLFCIQAETFLSEDFSMIIRRHRVIVKLHERSSIKLSLRDLERALQFSLFVYKGGQMRTTLQFILMATMFASSASWGSTAAEVVSFLVPQGEASIQYVTPTNPPRYPDPGRPPRRPPVRPPPDRGYPPPPPPRHDVTCTAVDTGHEEHRYGHGSCHECLQHHGNCIERCEATYEQHSCLFQGVDGRGGAYNFTGYGRTRYEAQDDALYACRRAGYYDCRYVSCNVTRDRQEVSRRYCR